MRLTKVVKKFNIVEQYGNCIVFCEGYVDLSVVLLFTFDESSGRIRVALPYSPFLVKGFLSDDEINDITIERFVDERGTQDATK